MFAFKSVGSTFSGAAPKRPAGWTTRQAPITETILTMHTVFTNIHQKNRRKLNRRIDAWLLICKLTQISSWVESTVYEEIFLKTLNRFWYKILRLFIKIVFLKDLSGLCHLAGACSRRSRPWLRPGEVWILDLKLNDFCFNGCDLPKMCFISCIMCKTLPFKGWVKLCYNACKPK